MRKGSLHFAFQVCHVRPDGNKPSLIGLEVPHIGLEFLDGLGPVHA